MPKNSANRRAPARRASPERPKALGVVRGVGAPLQEDASTSEEKARAPRTSRCARARPFASTAELWLSLGFCDVSKPCFSLIGTGLYRMLNLDFREHLCHALG